MPPRRKRNISKIQAQRKQKTQRFNSRHRAGLTLRRDHSIRSRQSRQRSGLNFSRTRGNLIFDGTHHYQYDGWSRLIRVTQGSGSGEIERYAAIYDALGRVVAVDREPSVPAPGSVPVGGGPYESWRELYHYDGSRRIQDIIIYETFNDPWFVLTQITEREYLWGPGYVDELLAIHDDDRNLFFTFHDANYNVTALLDVNGKISMEYGYDPYGEITWRASNHTATPAPQNPVGHQGLFADRIDGYAGTEALVPNARILYHNRNRTYDPRLGRFLQKDPNATGQTIGQLVYNGEVASSLISEIDLGFSFIDGLNLYQAVRSNPVSHTDPGGLWAMPGPSDMITGALSSLISEYSDRLEWDVEWASDWQAEDDWHSRLDSNWVTLALARGVYDSYYIGIPATNIGFNPLDAFAAGGLPAAVIVRQNGVTIRHNYRGGQSAGGTTGDHGGPTHVHVQSDGQRETRVGPRGYPVDQSDRPLTAKERAVFKNNRFEINRSIRQIQRWLRQQPGNPNRSGGGRRR